MPVPIFTRTILVSRVSNRVPSFALSPASALALKIAASTLKIVRSCLAVLVLIGAPLQAAQAGTPSYIGPYYYAGATSAGGEIVVNGLTTEEAVTPALVAQFLSRNPSACNVRSEPPAKD